MKQRGSFTLDASLIERLKRASREKNLPMSRLVENAIEGWLSRERGKAVKAGVVGVGHWGEQHCRAISELPGVELSAVCDTNPRKIAVGEKYNVEFYHSLEDILALPLDLVFSCVSIESLGEVSQEVARLGINCVVEKPFGRNLEEVKKLSRYENAVPELVELHNGAYTSLEDNLNMLDRLYSGSFLRAGTMPRRDLGVSCLWYLGVYDFALAYRLFGMPGEVLKEEAQDYAHVVWSGEGFSSSFYFDWRVPYKMREVRVFGENGQIAADLVNNSATYNNVSLQVSKEEPLKRFIKDISENSDKKEWIRMREVYEILKYVHEV